ncbi:MAG: SusC/RagA family TonB-linked outer membrane protein [Bacteroidaceae bacterium]|nr:SusC/RagA family TonB-linked outer membrane protein [Bacteroidaceae bacterium]
MQRFFYTLLFLSGFSFMASAQTQRNDTLSVGYARGNAKTLSGSVEKVGEDRMNKGLITNSLDALSGQAAGVSISTGTNTSAMLSSVRVRGTTSLTGGNDPLVIIDGVQSDLTTLSNIYPGDIESFTILKDASETAQYGSRGASGVIEVATKKGQAGNFHISYDANMGFESIYKNMKMLDANGYRNTTGRLGMSIVDNGFNSDFPSSITRTGFVQRHHVAFGGGTEQSSFRASLGFLDHNSVIQRIGNRNFTAKIDVNQKGFDNRLTVDLGMFGSFQKNKYIFDDQKLFYSSASFNPTFPTRRNADGSWSQYSDASQINHPVSLLDILDHDDNAHFNTHVKASFDLGHGLTIAAFGSYSYNVVNRSQFMPVYVWSHGQIYRGETKVEDLLGNFLISYERDFGKHHIDLLALGEAQKTTLKEFHTTASNLSTNSFGYNNLQAGAERLWEGTSSTYEDPRLTSFLGRVNYNYLERYSLTLNMRADASSKVGKNNRWGFFPSISGAWVISDEHFMREVKPYVNNLKLRLGYGLSGNLGAIDSYNSLELAKPNGVVPVNGSPTVTLGIIRNANPNLKWEVKHTFNVGLDMGFLDNRLVVTADYYKSKTSDMLYMYNVTVPPYPYDKLLANIGSMKNSGLEIGIGASLIQKRDIDFNANLNIAFQQNKLVSLSGQFGDEYLTAPSMAAIGTLNGAGFHGGYNDIVYQAVGHPLGVFYLPHCTGLTQQADGTYRYEIADLNNDGVQDVATDRYFAGQATPKVLIGSNFSFRYKDFDVSLQINGAFGHKIYNGTSLTYMNIGSLPYYNVLPEAPEKNISDQTATDYWLERGDYLNFDYLTIGWNVPLGRAKFVRNLRLSLSVNNLATITSYSGLTPMINSNVVSNTLGLDDKRTYPVYRSYSLGVSIQF